MSTLHKEIQLEVEICAHLAEHGWIYAPSETAGYDRELALVPTDLISWLKETQPQAWDKLSQAHGANTANIIYDRVRDSLNQHGTLHVLRKGVELLGLRQPLSLAQFKPASGMNADLLAKYNANRLRVVRQVRYSQFNENAIDLVLFLNGIPVSTVELKSDFTQNVQDAVDQYRFDRLPRPKGQPASEPLLSFPQGALVHFAVSNTLVRFATRLDGPTTRFFPFDRGNNQAAGNPLDESGGHSTAYLWQQVWQRDSWLEILGRYIVGHRDEKKQLVSYIFPRYHQLDSTRRLQAAIRAEGPGGKFLIQHSAGSGKTNSIAWSAHFLADLHNDQDQKLFDSILVVSDRNVLDSQLSEAILSFGRTPGVVETIKSEGSSKSGQLAAALAAGKKIIVCTIQTFPHALKAVQELAATEGKRFAVIADEAHSSQTGEAAAKLKALLSAEELAALGDGGEVSTEDLLAAQMAARSADSGITYIAFTATPKPKTIELFGRRPDPTRDAGPDNLPAPFHVYSMRQAIEEGFILDVLKNFTPYSLAFKLAHQGAEIDQHEVERSAALKGLLRWVRHHPYNISQKVEVVIEHYRDVVAPLLSGQAKAMVVVGSRLEAVRWQLKMDEYIKSHGYKIATLVAFSGEVNDPESGPDPFTETSRALNPNLRGRDIREAFNTPEYQVLLVANKFQTGFDQPLLCGMYVDKRLAGITAVQTLSRLNRAHPGKDLTFILDFVNEPTEILEAFKTYYETATLAGVTDPNLVFNLRQKLDSLGYYDEFEVNRVVAVELNPKSKPSDLHQAIAPVASRLIQRYKNAQIRHRAAGGIQDSTAATNARNEMEALELFKKDMGTFQRAYAFLSQIFNYENTDIEKRFLFFKQLLRVLDFGREREDLDLSEVVLTHHNLRNRGRQPLELSQGESPKLQPLTDTGSGSVQEKEKALLAEIIERVNDMFDGDLTDNDRLVYVNNVIKGKLLESQKLQEQAANNSKEQFASSPDLSKEILNAIMDALTAHKAMSTQALASGKIQANLKDTLMGPGELYEALRARSQHAEQERNI
jgi:type I restriction enzyme R subunit